MGLFKKLKRAVKGVRKALHLPALTVGNAVKLGAAVGTGGIGAGALALGAQAVKSKLRNAAIGGVKQVLRTKAERAVVTKIGQLLPKRPVPNLTTSPAETMPGGAPIKKAIRAVKTAPRRARLRRRAAASSGKASRRRRAPTGGKDFKALSASWRAAGKPGTWLGWVKSH